MAASEDGLSTFSKYIFIGRESFFATCIIPPGFPHGKQKSGKRGNSSSEKRNHLLDVKGQIFDLLSIDVLTM